MLCACSTHAVTKKRDHVTVISPRVTERHGRSYCARTTYQPPRRGNYNELEHPEVSFRLLY